MQMPHEVGFFLLHFIYRLQALKRPRISETRLEDSKALGNSGEKNITSLPGQRVAGWGVCVCVCVCAGPIRLSKYEFCKVFQFEHSLFSHLILCALYMKHKLQEKKKHPQKMEAANRKARNEKRYCMAIKTSHTDTHQYTGTVREKDGLNRLADRRTSGQTSAASFFWRFLFSYMYFLFVAFLIAPLPPLTSRFSFLFRGPCTKIK